MIELSKVLPVFKIVAALTFLSQATVVCVLVAGDASLRHGEKSLVQVSDLNVEFLAGSYVFGVVAFVAGHAGVFSDQVVASLTVVKAGWRGSPFDQGKIHAVMVGVAFGTPLARARLQSVSGMQSAMCIHAGADFGMTLHALEGGLPAELVAGDAMARALQCPVGAGQRPWRNLSPS